MAAINTPANSLVPFKGADQITHNDLMVGMFYPISDLENIDGPYGPQTIVYLEYDTKYIYLPKRMLYTDLQLDAMRIQQLTLHYKRSHYVTKFKQYTPIFEIVENYGQW